MITLKDSEFMKLVEFVKYHYGINLESKEHLIEGRLCNLITEKGFHSFGEYFTYVFSSGSKEELNILINRLTTNHTFFMREKEHFAFFEQTVLPQLHREVKDRDLRIWSAGCSSGEEPYTLAMIMQDHFANEDKLWDKKILATDISAEILLKAKNGVYTSDSVKDLSSRWKSQYFSKTAMDYEVSERIKNEIVFRNFNLLDTFPFKRKFHTIFCRNVMIYFDQKTKDKLIHKFYDMTEDGGYLFIGLSESIRREEFEYQYVMPSVYKKG